VEGWRGGRWMHYTVIMWEHATCGVAIGGEGKGGKGGEGE